MNEIENNSPDNRNFELKDNSKRAKTLLIVFWVLIGLTFLGLFADYNELQILKNSKNGEYISEDDFNLSDLLQGIIGLIQVGVYTTSVIVFLNWFRRAYGNLHRAGIKNIEHKETMAVWAWIIPILGFYRPLQIMKEIWIETQKKIKKFDPTYEMISGDLIIGFWWIFYIISNFLSRYILKTAFKQDTIEQLIENSEATLISDLIDIPEGLLIILIVYKLSKMESKLYEEIRKSGGNTGFAI